MKSAIIFILILFFSAVSCFAQEVLTLNTAVREPLHLPDQTGSLDLVIREIFNRIGRKVIIQAAPSERVLLNANQGIDDGEAARIGGLSEAYPNIIQIPEKIYDFNFVVFVKNAEFQPTGWETLKPYDVGIINGYKILERNIVGTRSLTKVESTDLLFTLLEKDRADVIVAIRVFGLETIKKRKLKGIKALSPPLAVKETFMYLHKKHKRDIVSRVAAALKEMKADGTYDRMLR